MMNLLKTIASVFSSKTRKVNRKLQISNCLDLIDNQQLKLAKAYKKMTVCIADLKTKLAEAESKVNAEENASVKAVYLKNIEIIKATIGRIEKSKSSVAAKLQKSEDTKVVLAAKKSLLDSIEALKGMTSNVFETDTFDVDSIMSEIDSIVNNIEAEFQADDELNQLKA